MTLTIPAVWQDFIQLTHQTAAWLWCWRVQLRETTSTSPFSRLVNHPNEIDLGGGEIYRPYPIIHSALEQNSDGDLPQMELQIDNTSKLLAPYVDQEGGFLNRKIISKLVNADDLTATFPFSWTIVACALTTQIATLRLEIDNWFERKVPMDVFHTFRCRHRFGDGRCGYVINSAAAFRDCDKNIDECIARGADMAARNLGARQPASFGGFLGIPL